eukprot:GFUD01044332.1.p1 GENE.GFUD01044332.1~~GFUD01044332.1.p1  ORF type:complete len:517 (+),score=101.68 GFUD01044332.1:36-1586(+)
MMKAVLISCLLLGNFASSKRVKRQLIDPRQTIDIVCSACEKRIAEKPPQICCRCIDKQATCNNDIASGGSRNTNRPKRRSQVSPGLTCPDDIDCQLFSTCSGSGCNVQGTNIIDEDIPGIEPRQGGEDESCPFGQTICCNPVDSDTIVKRLGLISQGNTLGEITVDTQAICEDPKLSAVQDFGHGVTCGKRDSRVYYDANLADSFTNPGEWPWAVLIFRNGKYIGAGALMDNDVVVTVGHKVEDFVNNPSGLTVRLGDWNPNRRDSAEEHPHIEKTVSCVRLHPDADLKNTLANNVAVLKLSRRGKFSNPEEKSIASVIDFKKGPERPADTPEGVRGSSKVERPSVLDLRLGLISQDLGLDPLGEGPEKTVEIPQSYINTVCLPRSERQFQNTEDNCWVAAWGQDLKRQREVDLPLVSDSECERRLRPIFEERGVSNWRLKPSEMCAGGVRNKDTCQGEGGAPLVCYDKGTDQYYAVGLVSYGFGCNNTHPAVYTNLGDASVQQFITSAFSNNNFC